MKYKKPKLAIYPSGSDTGCFLIVLLVLVILYGVIQGLIKLIDSII
jgi:hypothetical protein